MIIPTNPIETQTTVETVVSEEVTKTYDAIWVKRLSVVAEDPSQPIRAIVEFSLWDTTDNSLHPEPKRMHIRDLNEMKEQHPDTVGAAMDKLFEALEVVGKEKGLF